MTQTFDCPVDGCEYSGVKSSVLGHYSGKQDDDHRGGYERGRTLLEGEESAATGPSEETETEGTAVDPPTFEEEEEDPEEPTCPECGGNRYFDASEHTEYDYGCADCSTEDNWVVYDA